MAKQREKTAPRVPNKVQSLVPKILEVLTEFEGGCFRFWKGETAEASIESGVVNEKDVDVCLLVDGPRYVEIFNRRLGWISV